MDDGRWVAMIPLLNENKPVLMHWLVLLLWTVLAALERDGQTTGIASRLCSAKLYPLASTTNRMAVRSSSAIITSMKAGTTTMSMPLGWR